MREHIQQQISLRIGKWMDRECYNNGQCKICGCETTALQMADKTCDKPCYPPMMSKKEWTYFKKGYFIIDTKKTKGFWYMKDDSSLTFKKY